MLAKLAKTRKRQFLSKIAKKIAKKSQDISNFPPKMQEIAPKTQCFSKFQPLLKIASKSQTARAKFCPQMAAQNRKNGALSQDVETLDRPGRIYSESMNVYIHYFTKKFQNLYLQKFAQIEFSIFGHSIFWGSIFTFFVVCCMCVYWRLYKVKYSAWIKL